MTEHRQYYWITAHDDNGKPYLIYGGLTEDEARQKGFEMLSGLDFEIRKLPTRDTNSASRMLKGGRLAETHSLKEATKRVGHNKSIRRLRHQSSW